MIVTFCGHRRCPDSDALVAYVLLDSGGAAETRRFAKNRGKRIINFKTEAIK